MRSSTTRRIRSGGSASIGAVLGVSTRPGLITLARMPYGPPSTTSCRVRAITPPLAALCAFCGMNSTPRSAAIEPTLMIEPPPYAFRCGQAARTV